MESLSAGSVSAELERLPDPKRFEPGDLKVKQLAACAFCGGIVAGRAKPGEMFQLVFYRVTIDGLMVNLNALREHVGLTMITGSEEIAGALGTGAPIGKRVWSRELVICLECYATKTTSALAERDRDEEPEGPARG